MLPSDSMTAPGEAIACGLGSVTNGVTINLATGTATDGTNSVTWDTANGPFIEDVTGGSGADNIMGSTRANIVNGYLGADTINVKDNTPGDIVNCGSDTATDTVTKDDGDTLQGNSCDGDTIISTP